MLLSDGIFPTDLQKGKCYDDSSRGFHFYWGLLILTGNRTVIVLDETDFSTLKIGHFSLVYLPLSAERIYVRHFGGNIAPQVLNTSYQSYR